MGGQADLSAEAGHSRALFHRLLQRQMGEQPHRHHLPVQVLFTHDRQLGETMATAWAAATPPLSKPRPLRSVLASITRSSAPSVSPPQ